MPDPAAVLVDRMARAGFEPCGAEREAIVRAFEQEFECRVGDCLATVTSDEALDQFGEHIEDDSFDSEAWFAANCPRYRESTLQVDHHLWRELLAMLRSSSGHGGFARVATTLQHRWPDKARRWPPYERLLWYRGFRPSENPADLTASLVALTQEALQRARDLCVSDLAPEGRREWAAVAAATASGELPADAEKMWLRRACPQFEDLHLAQFRETLDDFLADYHRTSRLED